MGEQRLDSRLEAEGAEFLALGLLLAEGIECFKSYTRYPGYDLIAVSPDGERSCRIQVKSRWATDFDGGFLVKNYDCDFIVFVALNRGFRYRRKATPQDDGRRSPQIYVFPTKVVQDNRYERSKWGKVFLKHIPDVDSYRDHWELIRGFLKGIKL